MVDKYKNFEELSSTEKKDTDYKIFIKDANSKIALISPHGGGIEQGTSEIARAISDGKYNYYCFEGIKSSKNKEFLHITSTNFDEPKCIQLCENSETIITVHGAV